MKNYFKSIIASLFIFGNIFISAAQISEPGDGTVEDVPSAPLSDVLPYLLISGLVIAVVFLKFQSLRKHCGQ